MTTLTVKIENKKTEKAVKAVLDAFGLDYEVEKSPIPVVKPLNKAEQAMYERLKRSLEQIKLHQEGMIEMRTIEEVLAELSHGH